MSAPPESIGRYRIRHELGRGMMGVVYLAHDPDLSRDIALKVIQVPPGAREADREAFEQRFFAEAQSAARLSHPGIVIVHDVGRDPDSGALFMALQLLKGRTLDALLREKRRLGWKEALATAKRVAEALHHAHSEGVVHRDIKPANIMMMPTGEPKIMDFGIAKIETSRLTATGQFIGTPMYMSPEQAMARPVDGRSDIFSLGSVLYEMLTGEPAFGGDSVTRILYGLMSEDPKPPSTLVPSLSADIDSILTRCLAKEPEKRYQDAGALAQDIRELLGEEKPKTSPPSHPSPLALGPGGTIVDDAPPAPEAAWREPVSDHEWGSLETRALSGTERARQAAGRRNAMTAGAVLLGALGVFALWPKSPPPVARLVTPTPTPEAVATAERAASVNEPSPSPTPPPTPEADAPATLVIDFEHSLKSGVFKVFVDNLLVVNQPFDGRLTRKIIGLEIRKGRIIQTLEVLPGRRDVKVEVSWDDNVKTEISQTFFKPGGKLSLKAKVSGLRKGLSLEWK